mmetsp:Transcript_104679/g.207959  ORF Transcript_104679/g.207959 Transcript_104679/m.207959 type:complete len:223 (-) Transcript_104679:67-735(-)
MVFLLAVHPHDSPGQFACMFHWCHGSDGRGLQIQDRRTSYTKCMASMCGTDLGRGHASEQQQSPVNIPCMPRQVETGWKAWLPQCGCTCLALRCQHPFPPQVLPLSQQVKDVFGTKHCQGPSRQQPATQNSHPLGILYVGQAILRSVAEQPQRRCLATVYLPSLPSVPLLPAPPLHFRPRHHPLPLQAYPLPAHKNQAACTQLLPATPLLPSASHCIRSHDT